MCTRVIQTFSDKENKERAITGRNMDWKEWQDSTIAVYPACMERDGKAGGNSYKWQSKYTSVTTTSYGVSTSDGMNDQGLVVNLQWLSDACYPKPDVQDTRKPISVAIWAQYILDVAKDVKSAIDAMKNVYVVTGCVPTIGIKPTEAKVHLSVGDKHGNSVIFEYINGQLIISSNIDSTEVYSKNNPVRLYPTKEDVAVMTNQPTFEVQKKLNYFWEYQNESNFLPGTYRSTDRFVRATFYTKHLPRSSQDKQEELASILSVLHNVAGPIVSSTSGPIVNEAIGLNDGQSAIAVTPTWCVVVNLK